MANQNKLKNAIKEIENFIKTLNWFILVKISKLAGIDDFSCDEEWENNKSDWYNCAKMAKNEGN